MTRWLPRRLGLATAMVAVVALTGSAPAPARDAAPASPTPHFATPIYVDRNLAGGEPESIATTHGTLVYSAHEGTTHLFRDGVFGAPTGDASFFQNYRNQVNIWYSTDNGLKWTRVNYMNSGFFNGPHHNTGFSDPDLTLDTSGRLYNTGIDLGNDALFSSNDGGRTWPVGTVQCHNGDRPWLAGGHPNEVFLATDTVEGSGNGHEVFRSSDGGASCGQTAIVDNGNGPHHTTYSGFGKLYKDQGRHRLIEPAVFTNPNNTAGIGISVLKYPTRAFVHGKNARFTPHIAARHTSIKSHWPAISIGHGGTVFVVWDTDPRKPKTSGGCASSQTPLPNSILMAYTKNGGKTWSRPITIAHPGTTVLWPWVVAGSNGNVSVVWYQYDRVTDPDCGHGKVYVYEATVFDAVNPARRLIERVNASVRPIHLGGICQGGTTCVATGQDRRLGDYFTNTVDPWGCVIISTGDTMLTDSVTGKQLPTARPLFIRQDGGRSLTGRDCSKEPTH